MYVFYCNTFDYMSTTKQKGKNFSLGTVLLKVSLELILSEIKKE
jgi:hypothetical protein